jgi:hypothetical protein
MWALFFETEDATIKPSRPQKERKTAMQVGFSQVRFDGEFEFRMGGTFVNYMQSETEFHTPLYCSAWAVKAGENSFIWVSVDCARFMESDAAYAVKR